jgi:hypothetical protein
MNLKHCWIRLWCGIGRINCGNLLKKPGQEADKIEGIDKKYNNLKKIIKEMVAGAVQEVS